MAWRATPYTRAAPCLPRPRTPPPPPPRQAHTARRTHAYRAPPLHATRYHDYRLPTYLRLPSTLRTCYTFVRCSLLIVIVPHQTLPLNALLQRWRADGGTAQRTLPTCRRCASPFCRFSLISVVNSRRYSVPGDWCYHSLYGGRPLIDRCLHYFRYSVDYS